MRKGHDRFVSVTAEGAVLPADMLRRIADGDKSVEGLKAHDYHLAPAERINEAVSRSWNRLLGLWRAFQERKKDLSPQDSGRGMTREYWLLPLFQELGCGWLQPAKIVVIEEKEYPISHSWQHSPIHLMGCGVDLDRRKKGEPGASSSSPHSLVQEFLNRSHEHLWGLVSNGLKLRLLRDNVSLTRQAYIEFDLETMMEAEIYPDFLLLWLLCHQSRLEGEPPEACWLEKWHQAARVSGIRILDNLRSGVEKAIAALGQGFLGHRANRPLLDKLHTGTLSTMDFYRQLLRLVYRLIFLLAAESRDLLLLPTASAQVQARYNDHYSICRLRSQALKPRGGKYTDLWISVSLVFDLLARDEGCPDLGLPGLGSFLWSIQAIPDLSGCTLYNRDFLKALYYLSYVIDQNVRHLVDYKNLGPEELGSVYEALLELHPQVNTSDRTFELKSAGGSERKTTGSYYTPTSLIVSLLDTALEPVLKERKTEKEILSLKICDPACGSGHFLLAAAHRIARRLASLRTSEPEPAPADLRTALRDVIGHCIYGVDINPMAVELCKVALWMEALEPGKPLSFLDHRIQCGNSLVGAYPGLLEKGIPNEAFNPIQGDDKQVSKKYKILNRQESDSMGKRSLFDAAGEKWFGTRELSRTFVDLDAVDDSTMDGIHHKQAAYRHMMTSDDYSYRKLAADAWCAAFLWQKQESEKLPYPIHQEVFRNLQKNPASTPSWLKQEILRLADQYRFFHFHLAFPDVFRLPEPGQAPANPHTGWNSGFDVVLGNPPWERIKLQEKEWFAQRRPDIADAANAAARRRLIEKLKKEKEDLTLYQAFLHDRRQAEGESHFIRNSGKFPLCGRGDINTYAVFAETLHQIIGIKGFVGCILPSGIATHDTNKFFIQELIESESLVSLFDFTNRGYIFIGTESTISFSLITLSRSPTKTFSLAAKLWQVDALKQKGTIFTLNKGDISRINPNTLNLPTFTSKKDADLVKDIYKRTPILIEELKSDTNFWNILFMSMFHMTNDSRLFKTKKQLEMEGFELKGNIFLKQTKNFVPLYESKLAQIFNHRQATFAGVPEEIMYGPKARTNKPTEKNLCDPFWTFQPRYWIKKESVIERIPKFWKYRWLLGFRNTISAVADARSVVFTIIPLMGVGNSLPLIFSEKSAYEICLLAGNFNSFILDYVAKNKASGSNLNFYIVKQFPILSPDMYNTDIKEFIVKRVLELTYTAWDLQDFAKDVGYDGPPFVWDEERRFLLRCELDAAFFHLYGIAAEDVDYIMETFPIVKRKDEARYGTFRTKETILKIYNHMADSLASGKPYQTPLE